MTFGGNGKQGEEFEGDVGRSLGMFGNDFQLLRLLRWDMGRWSLVGEGEGPLAQHLNVPARWSSWWAAEQKLLV